MRKLFLFVLAAAVAGCTGGGPKVDPMSAQVTAADAEMVVIPDVCKAFYKFDKPRVAVAQFLNNTSYGKMTASNTSYAGQSTTKRTSAGVVGVVAAPGAIGVGHVGASKTDVTSSGQVDTYMREVAPKIGEYAQSATENVVANVGGMSIFDRSSLESILSEQKFQMAIADPDTAVRAGKLAGVQYIFAGTVDSISAKYVAPDKSNSNDTGNAWLNLALAVGKAAANTQTGWIVNVEMTVKMIDVETGQVVINNKVKGREVAGGGQGLNPELIAEAAKKAMGEAIDDVKPDLSQRFSPKGYIKQMRGNKSLALVNMGSDAGVKPGEKLEAFEFIEIADPFSGQKSCNMAKIPVEIVISDQIAADQSWAKIDGKPEAIARVKTGSIIKREKLEGQSMFKKMF
ncbi:MAG: CsgG/HfaB family protein [Deferribacterales bacterium]